MKKDIELIRNLLLKVDVADKQLGLKDFYMIDFDVNNIAQHLNLLVDGGYIKGIVLRDHNDNIVEIKINGLTFKGSEFVSVIRDENVWSSTAKDLEKIGGDTSLSIIEDLATQHAILLLGAKAGA